ncbi:kinase-like protein [Zopfia rhizophila CBS 207.26]|uniref:non-specific serine/threonine protein kinase n=1 Tax=Zopfia rhizophila CBS 207.26 TaxID=1314779 RepID=A0A6A6DSP4_9PEZI|nr:kinase-like protein [Zopfia rhizophila CBS 207.26]
MSKQFSSQFITPIKKRRGKKLPNPNRRKRSASVIFVREAPAKRQRISSVIFVRVNRLPGNADSCKENPHSLLEKSRPEENVRTKGNQHTARPLGYSCERVLKEGGQASTELWRHSSGGLVVAKRPYPESARQVREEADILKSILGPAKCSSIVEIIGECEIPNAPSAVLLEFCDGGDLWEYRIDADEFEKNIPESFIFKILVQLSSAVAYLHTGYGTKHYLSGSWAPVAHRDIKANNVLLLKNTCNVDPIIKLADFGCAAVGQDIQEQERCLIGTAAWQGPEAKLPLVTKATDIWGIGAVIHWLAASEMPIDELNSPQDLDDAHVPRRLVDFRLPPKDRQPNSCSRDSQLPWNLTYSEELWNLVVSMLDFDHATRPGAVELVNRVSMFIPN